MLIKSLSKALVFDRACSHAAALVVAGVVVLISACGFHLRGEVDLPFQRVFVQSSGSSSFATELRRVFERSTAIDLTDSANQAEVIVEILNERQVQQILSLSEGGSVNEYQLLYSVSYRFMDSQMEDLVVPDEIRVRRDLTYDDTQTLGKESEVQLLFTNMRSDAMRQMLRRLSLVSVPQR